MGKQLTEKQPPESAENPLGVAHASISSLYDSPAPMEMAIGPTSSRNFDFTTNTDDDDLTPKKKKNKEEEPVLAERETHAVYWVRALAVVVLIGVTVGVSLSVYWIIQNSEKANFESFFTDNAIKIVDTFLVNAKRRVAAIDSLALAITSHARASTSDRWPMVTLPDFERRVTRVIDQAEIISLIFLPIVTNETRRMWEPYSVYKQDWFTEGMVYQQEQQEQQEKRNGGDTNISAGQLESLEAIAQIGDGIDESFRINPMIYRLNGTKWAPETGPGPYLPVWQMSPSIPVADVVNFNVLTHPSHAREAYSCMSNYKPLISRALDLRNDTNPEVVGRKAFLNLFLSRWKEGGHYYEAGPVSDLYTPIYDAYDDSKRMVAMALSNIYWHVYFQGILADNVNGILAVLENQCGEAFTYEINGRDASYIGPGDLHDPKYDYLEESTGFGAFLPGIEREKVDFNCAYNVRVYPSLDMEEDFYSGMALTYALTLAGVFVLTALFFVVYDRCVERRLRVVETKAIQSGKVISELFPKQVQDRMFDRGGAPQNRARGFATRMRDSATRAWNGGLGEVTADMPIADLHQHCTIFFADIAGFTKWSSSREPTEVFKLLETLYGGFDTIASKLKVFKIETIGDCYVAATGLPSPQILHAVIMARFGALCLIKMKELCRQLVPILGGETATLGLRVGLHSGAVTAGVLRGEKARFQLFGDTVNTTARMESTGAVGRIHASQETADELIAAGKENWIEQREDKVVAKGKGEMITYWIQPNVDKKLLVMPKTGKTPQPCNPIEGSTDFSTKPRSMELSLRSSAQSQVSEYEDVLEIMSMSRKEFRPMNGSSRGENGGTANPDELHASHIRRLSL